MQQEPDQFDFRPLESTPPPSRRRLALWILTFPLLACLACAALTIYSLVPLRGEFFERLGLQPEPGIPVTGEDLYLPETPAAPTEPASPQGAATPEGAPAGGANPPAPGEDDPRIPKASPSYRATLDEAVANCTDSFHAFLVVEQAGFSEPGLFEDVAWRNAALDASTNFNTACKQLGSLPDAPQVYNEVDFWLKKAASEVDPATDEFNTMLSKSGGYDADQARSAMRHMVRFIQYTQRAEEILSTLKDLKQI